MPDRIEREQLIEAVPNVVWNAITSDGWLAEEVDFELRPGGDATFRSGDQLKEGWVEEARPSDRLVFWWSAGDEAASRVELTLTPVAEGTWLRVVETRPLAVLDLVGIPLPGSGGTAFGPALVAA